MDQAKPAHRTLLRQQRERGEIPDLDCHRRLRFDAIIKNELELEMSLSQILQILSGNVCSKEPLAQPLAKVESQESKCAMLNQLIFNN